MRVPRRFQTSVARRCIKSMQLLRLLATKKTWRHTGELEQGEGRFPKQSGGSLSSLRLPAIVHAPPASLPGG